ncbi:2-oxoacid dehydrogenase acyltransferase [Amylocarpus encephaloides]|uniref:Dihydrolipoamide acetyltransferase component of pyruvate dehydrogenase complex n=1 Tax=Amylocarpus encephaloides TaxID=45428 RepID=A0A9P7YL29_9HELO|nr:2-oxoacid dehydrogenase acyltransferase [Amylocarpus encephaloides]
MLLQRVTRVALGEVSNFHRIWSQGYSPLCRTFHASRKSQIVKPFLLADIGEGIRECEIIQWFVEPEAQVEEWDKLCEVQSDKASVEITSRFAGVIKKLHYEAGDMAKVGKALLDIDIQSDVNEKDLAELTGSVEAEESQTQTNDTTTLPTNQESSFNAPEKEVTSTPGSAAPSLKDKPKGKHASLATPAVRHLSKEFKVDITEIHGTGREGRVMKEDVQQFARQRDAGKSVPKPSPASTLVETTKQNETVVSLTNTQSQMFKSMTKALLKPHFLYADELDFSKLSELRSRLNKGLQTSPIKDIAKLSFLPFIVKAMSICLDRFPMINARVDEDPKTGKPVLIHRNEHNIGVAMDTPSGLLVPVIKNASSLSVLGIAAELIRLQALASSGKLSTQDLTGGTITLSNIGSIGGTYVSPVIVEKEVAILGVGKMRTIPAFGDNGQVIPKQVCNFSWSADHRVIDGATMARAAEVVKDLVENPDSMILQLR